MLQNRCSIIAINPGTKVQLHSLKKHDTEAPLSGVESATVKKRFQHLPLRSWR